MQFKRIGEITLLWTLLGLVLALYDHFLLISDISKGPADSYSIFHGIGFNLFAGFVGGIFGGTALTEIFQRLYSAKRERK